MNEITRTAPPVIHRPLDQIVRERATIVARIASDSTRLDLLNKELLDLSAAANEAIKEITK